MFDEWELSEHMFKASLLTNKILEAMDNSSVLLVDIELELGEGSVVMGPSGPALSNTLPAKLFQFHGFSGIEHDYGKDLDWGEAEAECSKSGGHLASIASLQEWETQIKPLIEGREYKVYGGVYTYYVTLGGSDLVKQGLWQWSDGTTWNSTSMPSWRDKDGGGCLQVQTSSLDIHQGRCQKSNFLCKNKNIEHIEVPTKRLRYTLASLPKPAFQLVFRHDYVEGNLTSIPGFSLSWRVANKSFTSKTPVLSQTSWEPILPGPKHRDIALISAGLLAARARSQGIKREDLIDQFKQKKEKLGNLCDGDKLIGNITTAFFNFWIRNVAGELGFPINNDTVFITKEDKATGLQLYSSLVYCSTERDRALAFLEKLIFNNSPATLLLATVNTIQLAPTKDNVVWKAFRDFYKVLEKELDLKYGRILMALASPEELRAFKARDWPYMDLYETELDKCLQGDCEGAQGVVQQLGTIYWLDTLQIFKILKISDPSVAEALFSSHLVSPKRENAPFSLVPFCAYHGNLSTMGTRTSVHSKPVCLASEPIILHGQICYKLLMDNIEVSPKPGYSLQLFLDTEPATPDAHFELSGEDDHHGDMIEDGDYIDLGVHADIYIPTLSKLRAEAVGTFSLSDIKQMTGSEKFLEKKDFAKGCSEVDFEECQSQKFLENVQKDCNCVPWQLSAVLDVKVSFYVYQSTLPIIIGCQLDI